jgi:hypothetical protein
VPEGEPRAILHENSLFHIAADASVHESPEPSLLGSEISFREGRRGVLGPAEFVEVVSPG